MLLRKLGHSCLLAEEAGAGILFDPGCFAHGLADLRDLTAVLITHIHEDHLDFGALQSVLAANPAARIISDEASAAALADRGVRAEAVREGDVLDLGLPVSVAHGRDHAVIHPDLEDVADVELPGRGPLFCAACVHRPGRGGRDPGGSGQARPG